MFNFGTGIYAWLEIGMIITFIILGLWYVAGILDYKKWKGALTKKRHKKIFLKRIVGRAIVLLLIGTLYFFAFGPGTNPDMHRTEGKSGMMQVVEEAPDEKGKEVIKSEAYKKKESWLQDQDRKNFEEEREQSDDYIKKALERAKEREGN